MIKKILVFARKSIKLTILLGISILLIVCAVAIFFKPIYSVYLNGEQVGYSQDKSDLQAKINTYMESGDGKSNIAFVQIDDLPEYKICLLKRNIVTNDDEIFEKVKEGGIPYYKYYGISLDEEIKAYVSEFSTAEEIVNDLKEKNSNNIDKIAITEIYETELKEFSEVDAVVASLYEKKPVVVKTQTTSIGKLNTSTNISFQKVPINLNFIRPITGTISSRFGVMSSRRVSNHTGLDIAAKTGTPIKAAATGTVTFSGTHKSYGKLLVVSHGNGIETYYGHCSKLYVSAGEQVKQGEVIAAVGSTGNSTGPHLHLEIRINGVAYNPQNYVY